MHLCWPNAGVVSTTAGMLSRLSERFEKLICGSFPGVDDAQPTRGGRLSSPLLFSATRGGRRSSSGGLMTPPAASEEISTRTEDEVYDSDEETAAAAIPCVAFGSMDGYKVFNFGENRMCDDGDVRLRLACGRRHVPSPHGGKVFVTEMRGRYQSHLVDAFTGERTPLPDLPIPFCEEEPMPFDPDEPRARCSTDDRFAWDWSPLGVMVARGDTVFFCESGGGGGGETWTPVHRSRRNSRMTVNYRDGFFFLLELRSLVTTVIDAVTLVRWAVIEAPPRIDTIDRAFLVASTDDVLLLVRRRAEDGGEQREVLTHVYRARHRQQRRRPRWSPVTDIGDRAAFVDGAHGFTVRAGDRVQRNRLHMLVRIGVEEEEPAEVPSTQHGGAVVHVVIVAPLSNMKKVVAEGGSELRSCKVQTIWGAAHWIICNHGSSSSSSLNLRSNIALGD